MKSPAHYQQDRNNIFQVKSANKRHGNGLSRIENQIETLKKKAVVATAAALGMALLYAQGARAAAPASDNGSAYQNPWGPVNAQSQPNSGFAPWVFDWYNPPTYVWPNTPPPGTFFIDTTKSAWGINLTPGYDAAWISFTGDGELHPGQTFSTTVLYTPPGSYSPTQQYSPT